MNLIPLGGDTIEYRSEPRRDTYTLTRSIVVQDTKTGSIYGVPAGFECDGATSQWIFRKVTRAFADDLYAATCRAFGSNRAWSGTQWATLRVWPGTWLIWARHRRRNLLWTGATPSSTYIPDDGGAS